MPSAGAQNKKINAWYKIVSFYEICSAKIYRKTSNISGSLRGNNIVDHSDVAGASPVGAAPTSSSFST